MTPSEVALLTAVAVGALGIGAAEGKKSEKPPEPAPGKPEEKEAAAPPTEGRTDRYRTSLFTEWSGFITTAGALAAAVGAYQLTKDLGKGVYSSPWQQVAVIVAALSFAFGVGVLITIPIRLRTGNVVLIADAVALQQQWNRSLVRSRDRKVVAPSSLFGFADISEFEAAYTALVTEARERYWSRNQAPPPSLTAKLTLFTEQRRAIEDAVATVRLRGASRVAILSAVIGLLLAVAGYSVATLLTNEAVRRGDLADAEVAQQRVLDKAILDDALAEPGARAVLPTKSQAVTVAIPASRAGDVLGLGTAAAAKCLDRSGVALDIGTPPEGLPAERVVYVALTRTADCPAGAAWVEASWASPSA